MRELFDGRVPQLPPRYSPYKMEQQQEQPEVTQSRFFAGGDNS